MDEPQQKALESNFRAAGGSLRSSARKPAIKPGGVGDRKSEKIGRESREKVGDREKVGKVGESRDESRGQKVEDRQRLSGKSGCHVFEPGVAARSSARKREE